MRLAKLHLISVAAIAAPLSFTPPAYAQEAAEEAQGLEEIVVTAQRRQENLQDVPLAVSAVRGETLEAVTSGGADIRSLAGRAPSLNIESSFGRAFPRFYIRGLGNTDFDLNASQPVSLVYDDVVLENPIIKGFPVFDLDRVEVLRGPQGTLFGRNTPAGIVKFDSVKPGDKGSHMRASYGSFGSVTLDGAADIAFSDIFSARISANYQHRDDWVDNLDQPGKNNLEGYDELAARIQFQLKQEDLTIRLTGQFRDLDGTARLFRANSFATGSNNLVGQVPGEDFDRDVTRADGVNFQNLKNQNASLFVEYDFGAATLTSVSSYWHGTIFTRGDIDGGFGNQFAPPQGPGFIPFSAQTQDNVPSLDQFTQEIRIASNNEGGLGYQAGVFYFDENLDIETLDFGSPTDLTADAVAVQRQDSRAYGVFGTLTYALENGLKFQAGARYNDDKRDFSASRPVDTRPGFLGFGGPVAELNQKVKSNTITWDASAFYPLSDDVNVFARIASGYRAPSIQGRLAFDRTLSVADEEKTLSYEAGIKSELLDRKLRLNLTGYYFNTKDLQLTAVGGASNFTTLLNADKVNGYGVEAELEARPVDNLQFSLSASYNIAQIDDSDLFVAGCGAPCTVTDPVRTGSTGIYSIDGNQLPQSPKLSLNATLGYGIPVGNGEVYAFTDWYYRSKINFFLYESVEFNDDKLLEGGLRLGYRTDTFDLALFGRNITDDVSAVGGIDFNNLTGFLNEPRIWGVEAGVKF